MVRSKKALEATDKGVGLIEIVHDKVKSPEMTGEWEAKLKAIERGEGRFESFMDEIEAYVARGRRESAARVRAAIHALGLAFPDRRVTVNLAPASLPKGGAGLDLAIAIGILAAMGAVPCSSLGSMAFVGELALDGRLRPVPGALPMARALARARGGPAVFAAAAAKEAAFAPGLVVFRWLCHAATVMLRRNFCDDGVLTDHNDFGNRGRVVKDVQRADQQLLR